MKEEINKNKAVISRRKFIGAAATLSSFFIFPRNVLGGKGFIAPSDQITLGFIGAGRQGLTLRNAFQPSETVKIVAACDVYHSKTTHFCQLTDAFYKSQSGNQAYKACLPYDHFTKLLERKDIDAVVIATPDHWHGVMAVMAAAAKKDIYCEKPLSLTVAEGRDMVKAVNRYKRVFQTGSMQRSKPEFRKAVELVRNGYIGDVENIKVSIGGPPVLYDLPKEKVPADLIWNMWLGPNPYVHYNHQLNPVTGDPLWARWRDFEGLGGGGITDWGAHMFDIVQWALDMDRSGPVKLIPPNDKDIKHLTFIYKNGVVMTHEDFGKKNAIQFNGKEGTIEIQRGKLVTLPANLNDQVFGEKEIRVYHSDNHYLDFIEAIKKRSNPVADVETGHRSATVCNLANIAYKCNKPLNWSPEKEVFLNDNSANKLLSRKLLLNNF